MITLIKVTLKLLVRNKGFLFFMLFAPLMSIFMFKTSQDADFYKEKKVGEVINLENCDSKAGYFSSNGTFRVKVYDAAEDDLSEYFLLRLSDNSMFSICRAKTPGFTFEDAKEQAKKDAFEDKSDVILYLPEGFAEKILDENCKQFLALYYVSDDSRADLFDIEAETILKDLRQVEKIVGEDSDLIVEYLENLNETMPKRELVDISDTSKRELTDEQMVHKTAVGYAFAFMTFGYIFMGIFVAHGTIKEQKNGVFTRISLSGIPFQKYFTSKVFVAMSGSALMTLLTAIFLLFINPGEMGMSKVSFLVMIFGQGLIFSVLSLVIGVLIGDVMSSNFMAFTVWSFSAMLSGLYFPLDDSSRMIKICSYMMPQRWFMDISEMIFVGDNNAYFMILCCVVAYLLVFISVGSVGLKIRRAQE